MSHRPAAQTSVSLSTGARVFVQLLQIERNPACERQVTRTVPGACAGHGLLVMNLEMFRRGQWFAPPPASSSVLITASKLTTPAFGGSKFFEVLDLRSYNGLH